MNSFFPRLFLCGFIESSFFIVEAAKFRKRLRIAKLLPLRGCAQLRTTADASSWDLRSVRRPHVSAGALPQPISTTP